MFTVRRCYTSDSDEVFNFLKKVFYQEEPLAKANRIQPDILGLIKEIVPQGYSLLALSKQGRIIGITFNEGPPQNFNYVYTTNNEDIKFQELFSYMERESGVLTEAPGALEVLMGAVDPEWRKLGVGVALADATLALARQAGFPFVKAYCTSEHSSKLLSKLGWRLLYSLSYSRYLEEHPSDLVLPPEPHTHCKLFVIDLNNYPRPVAGTLPNYTVDEPALRSRL